MKHFEKKLLCLLVVFIILNSCTSQKNSIEQANLEAKIAKEGIVGQKIGFISKTGKAKLLVSNEIINKAMGKLIKIPSKNSRKVVERVTYDNSKIFNKNEVNYLQSFTKDGMKTTTLLRVIDSELYVAGISCTSKVCADSETACIPRKSGKSCTPCNLIFSSDCTKTVSNDNLKHKFQ